MLKDTAALNRSILVDSPIVEMLLAQKFSKSSAQFIHNKNKGVFSSSDFTYHVNGVTHSINVRRNSSKHYKSPNFILSIDKNRLDVFNNASFVFIDETADSLYIVNGVKLLAYVLEHSSELNISESSPNKGWILISKNTITDMISDNPNATIKYNKHIAKLFELGRDENQYKGV